MNETRPPTKLTHLPGLDGLRGMAVIGVLFFHGGFDAFKGGFLGVSTFFTLSGFLITSLLLREHAEHGTISLRAFWRRRFRRLMPAALAGLLVACAYGWWFATPEQLATLRGDLIAALGYVANWRFVLEDKRYADLFSLPSPVQHFWSLAIEEQFYVVYPLLVAGALHLGGRRALSAVLSVLGVLSVVLSFALSGDADRVYYGTDTRAFELLLGGLFAMWWLAPRGVASGNNASRAVARSLRDVVGIGGLVASLAAWTLVGQTSPHLAKGGFALQALATCAILLAVTSNGWVAAALSWRPLRAVGLVSYGLYVYHWPVFLTLDGDRTGLGRVPLFALRMVVTVAIALASYVLIEQPIRRHRVLQGRALRMVASTSVVAVFAASLAVTWDPPQSVVAYANANPDEYRGRVVDYTTIPRPPTTTDPTRSLPVKAPSTVLLLGDSGMLDLQPALGAAFGSLGTSRVVMGGAPAFGLRESTGWRALWTRLVETHRPELIVVMFGGWDIPILRQDPIAYRRVVDEALAMLTSRGARVQWLAMMPGGATSNRPVDPIYAAAAAAYPGIVDFFDPEAVFRTGTPPNEVYGRVLTIGGERWLIRKPDGWHLCPEGAARLSAAVVARAHALGWSPNLLSGWDAGSWRSDAAFQDPVGGCDPRAAGADK